MTQPAPAAEAAPGIDRSHRGEPLPDLSFRDAAGHALKLRAAAGKPLLVNLWATWCAPCVVELPSLEALAVAREGHVKVITVSQDSGAPATIARFLADHHLPHLPGWLDPALSASAAYGVTTLPTTIYYDAQGREQWRWIGHRDWSDAQTARLLDTPAAR